MLKEENKLVKIKEKSQYSFLSEILVYTIIFVITALGVYFWFLVCDRTMLINRAGNNDGFSQQYMVYAKIKHIFEGLMNGEPFSLWSWDIGLGGDLFYYFKNRLLNPFTYIVIAFPEKYLDIGYGFMVVLKQYCAGLAFMLFAREIKFDVVQKIFGAMCYAFSGWMIMESLNESGFTNAAVLLPLLIMGIDKILKKKSPYLFIIIVFFYIAVTTTFAYIAGIISILYYIVRYKYYNSDFNAQIFIKDFGRFIFYGITGILLASFFLIVYIMSISNTTTESAAASYNMYTLKEYLTIFTGFFKLRVMSTPCSYYYMPCICIAFMPLILCNIKKKSTVALLSAVLFVASLFPITGSIFNGFGYSVGRWFFVLIFFMVWAAMECFDKQIANNTKNLLLSFIWLIFLAVWNIGVCYKWLHIIDDNGMISTIFGVFFGCVIIGILFIKKYKFNNTNIWVMGINSISNCLIAIVLIGSIIGVGWLKFYPGIQDNIYEYMKIGEAQEVLKKSTQRVGTDIQNADKEFFRIDNADGYLNTEYLSASVNENIYFGNRSIYSYFSILDSDWLQFNEVLGNNCGYSTRTCVLSNDNRSGLDLLFGVKYFLGNNSDKDYNTSDYAGYGFEKCNTIDGVEVFRNKYSIGLGTVYSQYITESELKKYSYLEREQIMLQAAVISDDIKGELKSLKHAGPEDLEVDLKEVEYKLTNLENIDIDDDEITVYDGGGEFDIESEEIKNCQIVVCFENITRKKNTYEERQNLLNEKSKKRGILREIRSRSFRDNQSISINVSDGNIEKNALYRDGGSTGIAGIEDFTINMGYYNSFSGNLHITLKNIGYYKYDDIKVYAVPTILYDKNASVLENNRLDITRFEQNEIQGEIKADNKGILYLSILDNPGWKVYANGKELKKINNLNIAFTGCVVEPGTYDVIIKYEPVWVKPGVIGSSIGVLMLLIVIIYRKRKK